MNDIYVKFVYASCVYYLRSSKLSKLYIEMLQLFTNQEHADMIFLYDFCNGNTRAAIREY